MQDLIILGIDTHVLEVAEFIERINQVQPSWNLRGYLADDDSRVGEMLNGYPVLGEIDAWEHFPEAYFVPDIGHRQVVIPTNRLATIIDPSTFVSRTATIGAGCVVYPGGFIGANVVIGDGVMCLSRCVINHEAVIENGVCLASGVTLAGGVHIEADCYLGQACSVRQSLRIAQHSVIGMGAVVIKDVPPNSVMAGNPAKPLPQAAVAEQ